ncbi:uncharacterized protein LOC142563290 [Dermacentor variabilis]|uniref:uncharacterized protein LOC142563290 n=1 Tax=Dermacentor variabilis TaxID=34621 RepID=UPI003F5B1F48
MYDSEEELERQLGLPRPSPFPTAPWVLPTTTPSGNTSEKLAGSADDMPSIATPAVTAPTTTTIQPLPWPAGKVPLVCAVSNEFSESDNLPPDGLCDLLFFDSLYRDGRNLVGGPYEGGFERFLKLGRQMRATGVGVSFDMQ